MIIDVQSLPDDQTIQADICIIGGGPAGITLARELAKHNYQICLVESGSFEFDPKVQSLCEGEVVSDLYPPLQDTRQRQFGGTAQTWEAPIDRSMTGWRSIPLDEIDFEERDWVKYSGWPFKRSHLIPYYEQAQQVCQLGSFAYESKNWETGSAACLLSESQRLTTTVSQYGYRAPFTDEYLQELKQSEKVALCLDSNVTRIDTNDECNLVTSIHVVTTTKKQFQISAKISVLAAGGIENARLLLLSDQKQKSGLGNENDLVGRFFMDHPSIYCGTFTPYKKAFFDSTDLYHIRQLNDSFIMGELRISEEVLKEEKILNNGIQIFPKLSLQQTQAQNSVKALHALVRSGSTEVFLKECSNIIRNADYLTAAAFWKIVRRFSSKDRGIWTYFPYEKRKFSELDFIYQVEQSPDPNNRVLLSNDRDYLGLRKSRVEWSLNSTDLNTIARVKKIIAEEISQSGLGHFQEFDGELNFYKKSGHHHIGTTRMHCDPAQGVVNENCRVHSISNLFITGSSVFPTGGYANPTLTIIALAIRLADHLKAHVLG